jgi:hypothetical protein
MVKIRTTKTAQIKVSVSNTGQMVSGSPVTVKSTDGSQRLDTLRDVDASNEIDGGVLTYDEETDKYVTRPLNDGVNDGEIDGGTF